MRNRKELDLRFLLVNGLFALALAACGNTPAPETTATVPVTATPTSLPTATPDTRFGFHGDTLTIGPTGLNMGDVFNYLSATGRTNDAKCYVDMITHPRNNLRLTPVPNPDGSTSYAIGGMQTIILPESCTNLVADVTPTAPMTDPLEIARATATAEALAANHALGIIKPHVYLTETSLGPAEAVADTSADNLWVYICTSGLVFGLAGWVALSAMLQKADLRHEVAMRTRSEGPGAAVNAASDALDLEASPEEALRAAKDELGSWTGVADAKQAARAVRIATQLRAEEQARAKAAEAQMAQAAAAKQKNTAEKEKAIAHEFMRDRPGRKGMPPAEAKALAKRYVAWLNRDRS